MIYNEGGILVRVDNFSDNIKSDEDFLLFDNKGSFDHIDTRLLYHPKEKQFFRGTKVLVKNHDTGEVLFSGSNKTMIAGSEFMALHLFNLPHDTYITPTYNNALNLDNTVNTHTMENAYVTQLFCMGTSGCNRESSLKYEVDNKHWIYPNELVPFMYVPFDDDLDNTRRNTYFGRKTLSDVQFYAYYFKKFDSDPVLKRQLEDGTPIDSTIYDNTSTLAAQVVVTMSMSVSRDDGRDYFINTTGINDGRFNCIELCVAWTKVIGGYTYYQDIRPITRINFTNQMFSDLDTSWDILYSIYF